MKCKIYCKNIKKTDGTQMFSEQGIENIIAEINDQDIEQIVTLLRAKVPIQNEQECSKLQEQIKNEDFYVCVNHSNLKIYQYLNSLLSNTQGSNYESNTIVYKRDNDICWNCIMYLFACCYHIFEFYFDF